MNAESYKSWAKSYGPNVYELICKVIGTFRYEEQSYKSCNGILNLCKNNPKAFSDTATKICLESHIYSYTDFKKMLTKLINEKKTNRSETLPLYHFKLDLLICALFDAYDSVNKKVEISHKYRKFQKFNRSYTLFTKFT